jgi:hypothetical protein
MGPIGVGTTYQQVRSVPSRSEERLEITTYSPPRQLEIRGQLGPFASRLFYAPNTSPEGTRVTNTVEVQLRGPGRLLGRVAVPRVREAVAANLRKLKNCWRDSVSGDTGGTTRRCRPVTSWQPRHVNDLVRAYLGRRFAGCGIGRLARRARSRFQD